MRRKKNNVYAGLFTSMVGSRCQLSNDHRYGVVHAVLLRQPTWLGRKIKRAVESYLPCVRARVQSCQNLRMATYGDVYRRRTSGRGSYCTVSEEKRRREDVEYTRNQTEYCLSSIAINVNSSGNETRHFNRWHRMCSCLP